MKTEGPGGNPALLQKPSSSSAGLTRYGILRFCGQEALQAILHMAIYRKGNLSEKNLSLT